MNCLSRAHCRKRPSSSIWRSRREQPGRGPTGDAGYDYAQLGAELARRWNLSEAFVDAISQQLDPLSHDPVSKEAVLIRLAVFISFAWNAGVPAQAIIARFPKPLADQLGLDPKSLAGQLETLHEQGNALADLLTQ